MMGKKLVKKYFNIDCELKTELAEKFMSFVNENTDCHITVFIDSPGGWNVSAQTICTIINSEPERFAVVAGNNILSSAFWLFFSVDCPKIIQDGTIGMYHLSRANLEIRTDGIGADKVHDFTFEQLKKDGHGLSLTFCKRIGMSEAEIDGVLSGKDVCFSTERMIDLLQNDGF